MAITSDSIVLYVPIPVPFTVVPVIPRKVLDCICWTTRQVCSVLTSIATARSYLHINPANEYNMARITIDNAENNKADEPNPPSWPPSVKVFYPNMTASEIMKSCQETQDPVSTVNNITSHTSAHHFVNQRWALLFAPGTYRGVDVEIGYYVQLAGLGQAADDVRFVDCEKGPHVPSLNQNVPDLIPWGTGLDTFWRCAENFYSNTTTTTGGGMNWVVSQAAPLRRVHVATDLNLCYGGAFVSGGVLANARIDGQMNLGGQQQWLSRNVDYLGKNLPIGGAWSTVHVGCTGAVPDSDAGSSKRPAVSVEPVPLVRVEKPYIVLLKDGRYQLRVPQPTFGKAAVGSDLTGRHDQVRDFSRVKVARADIDSTETLQMALDEGKDLALSPGIYTLQTSLKIRHANQVLLGLGLATLVAPKDGSPCIRVLPNRPGVRVAGIMLQASKQEIEANFPDTRDCPDGVASLLEWGYPDADDRGQTENPGVLTDVFARVGGPDLDRTVSTDVMIRIHSSNVVGDNLWLWRADHLKLADGEKANYPSVSKLYFQTMKDQCKCANGLIVNGDHVTIYGLAVEHTEEHQVIWNGNHGRVSFYQSELPYDVTQFSFGEKDYTGFVIHESVDHHEGIGLGIYSNFRDWRVRVQTAARHPNKAGVRLSHLFTVRLDNYGTIESVVNGKGTAATGKGKPYRVDDSSGGASSRMNLLTFSALVVICVVGLIVAATIIRQGRNRILYALASVQNRESEDTGTWVSEIELDEEHARSIT